MLANMPIADRLQEVEKLLDERLRKRPEAGSLTFDRELVRDVLSAVRFAGVECNKVAELEAAQEEKHRTIETLRRRVEERNSDLHDTRDALETAVAALQVIGPADPPEVIARTALEAIGRGRA